MIDFIALQGLISQAPAGPRLQFGCRADTLHALSLHSNRTTCVGSFDGTIDPHETLAGMVSTPPDFYEVRNRFLSNSRVEIIKGYMPEVTQNILSIMWSFVLVDVYHYAPTFDAIMWAWPRVLKDGIICCAGWDAKSVLFAASAINEISNVKKKKPEYVGRLAYWKM